MEKHRLGGVDYVAPADFTLEQDVAVLAALQRAGAAELEIRDGETPEDWARRTLYRLAGGGQVFELLAALLVPADAGRWSPKLAAATAAHLRGLTAAEDREAVLGILAGVLASFLEAGLISATSSGTSSRPTVDRSGRESSTSRGDSGPA